MGVGVTPQGTPANVTDEFARRGERVLVRVWLERGQLEDLELLLKHRNRGRTRSAAVREAVSWLLAREAATLVRWRDLEERRRRKEEEERRAIEVAREQRDAERRSATLQDALAIALRNHDQGVSVAESVREAD